MTPKKQMLSRSSYLNQTAYTHYLELITAGRDILNENTRNNDADNNDDNSRTASRCKKNTQSNRYRWSCLLSIVSIRMLHT